ncbi:hypothetical protein L1049_025639 [Liquidambar formosana]|uniref:Uncharacterized protein n=1 Tax=Liquidambar formosana TaxID=63359 RepID=A0AAP0NDH2_LIQFO
MATEDFTFPSITTTPSRFIDSPPLWRVSSPAFSDSCLDQPAATTRDARRGREEEDVFAPKPVNHYSQRKSFSCVESSLKKGTGDSSEDEEDKMDMLWEDFNEELLSKRNCSRPDSDHTLTSKGEKVELGCVKALAVSKTSSRAMVSARRRPAGMVVFVKVIKKLFLLHN